MLTPNTVLRIIDGVRERLEMDNTTIAKTADIHESRWREIRLGRRKLYFEDIAKVAEAVGLSVQLVSPQHEPFLRLSPDEAKAILELAAWYKRNGPSNAHIRRTAVEKLIGR